MRWVELAVLEPLWVLASRQLSGIQSIVAEVDNAGGHRVIALHRRESLVGVDRDRGPLHAVGVDACGAEEVFGEGRDLVNAGQDLVGLFKV